MDPKLSSDNSGAAANPLPPLLGDRFTSRLEAFSDLVFGFSLSLLATRLEVPATVNEVFESTRWGTFVVTFGMICVIWLAHYRIFRHRFVAQVPDVVVNFVFLLGIAVLPYSVQTFLRFPGGRDAVILYFGDFALVFASLATLRWRALLQRRGDPDTDARLREWRGVVRQSMVVLVVIGSLIASTVGAVQPEKLLMFIVISLVAATLITRRMIQRLPKFME